MSRRSAAASSRPPARSRAQTAPSPQWTAPFESRTSQTEEPQLTGHLNSEDFFHGEKYPEITFKSTSIEPADDDKLRITGDLTIRGVTKPVELDAELEGVGDGPDGNPRLGISAGGAIDRSEWGIVWNQPLANGALAVAERVTIQLHVEAVKQA